MRVFTRRKLVSQSLASPHNTGNNWMTIEPKVSALKLCEELSLPSPLLEGLFFVYLGWRKALHCTKFILKKCEQDKACMRSADKDSSVDSVLFMLMNFAKLVISHVFGCFIPQNQIIWVTIRRWSGNTAAGPYGEAAERCLSKSGTFYWDWNK